MRQMIALGFAIVAILIAPSAASAHYSNGWYWSTSYAERKIEARDSDVMFADCTPWGRRIRSETGGWLYKHFDCIVEYYEYETEEYELHVTGRRWFRLL